MMLNKKLNLPLNKSVWTALILVSTVALGGCIEKTSVVTEEPITDTDPANPGVGGSDPTDPTNPPPPPPPPPSSSASLTDSDNGSNAINEYADSGRAVGVTASAQDFLAGESVTYSLTFNAGGRFTINSNTGVISVLDGDLLESMNNDTHTVQVEATGDQGSSAVANFSIDVIGDNCGVKPGQASNSVYDISWDEVDHEGVVGYEVLFGDSSSVNRASALDSVMIDGGTTTTTAFIPNNFNLLTCDPVYISIATRTDQAQDSELSPPVALYIE